MPTTTNGDLDAVDAESIDDIHDINSFNIINAMATATMSLISA